MEISVSGIDEDDLVSCAGLYVATFREQPWNEEWNVDDAFDRLNDFLATPKSICIKAISKNKIRGFFLRCSAMEWIDLLLSKRSLCWHQGSKKGNRAGSDS